MENTIIDSNPLTYLDRNGASNPKYYFVSYSHKDRDDVFSVLDSLYKSGVNYWYDVELDPGDEWNQRVEKVLDKENYCMGAIVFLSVNSLLSKAVRQELRIMKDIREKRSFRIVLVIIGFDNPDDLIFTVISNRENGFYKEKEALSFQELAENCIYITLGRAKDDISKLSEKDNVNEGKAVNKRNLRQQEMKYNSSHGEQTYLFGQYPFDVEEQIRDIEWKLISNIGSDFYFISRYCIDFVDIANIEKTIQRVRDSISEKERVKELKLIDEEFLSNYKSITVSIPTDYADRNRQQLLRLFWVSNGNGIDDAGYSLYNSQNKKVNENIHRDQINAGIRLVLVYNNDG